CLADLVCEPNATGTKNASFLVEENVRPNREGLLSLDLIFNEATIVSAVLHIKILQVALTGLVAYRTVERMVDEQKLQHRLPGLVYRLRLGNHIHPILSLGIRGNLELRHIFYVDQTHSAAAGDR